MGNCDAKPEEKQDESGGVEQEHSAGDEGSYVEPEPARNMESIPPIERIESWECWSPKSKNAEMMQLGACHVRRW